jgi:hypothetical protein
MLYIVPFGSHVPTSIQYNGSLHIASCVWICSTRLRLVLLHEYIRNVAQSFFHPEKTKKETYCTYNSITKQRLNWWTLSLVEILDDGKQYIYIYI